MLLTNFHLSGEDNLSGYARLHGHPPAQRIPEFGEQIMWWVPKRLRHKLDPRWRVGSFIGRSWNSDQNMILINDGSVVRARAMVRLVESKRWDAERLEHIPMTPDDLTTATTDATEVAPAPLAGLQPDKTEHETDQEPTSSLPRRLPISNSNLEVRLLRELPEVQPLPSRR